MANDFSVDELNEQLQKTNELLKAAEKRFEDLLKIVKNLQRNASITGVASNATAEYNKRAEKKTLEWSKQMDKMMHVREQLINLEYDNVRDLERERQERTRQFILERRKTAGMIEDAKTRRKEMSLQGKRLDLYTKAIGSVAGGAGGGLGGFIGMGVGSAIGGITAGAEGAREKTSGLQQRLLNYQQQAGQMEKTSIGTPTGKIQSNMLARLEKISPKLASFAYGKEGDDGTRKGGALGKGAGAIGKMGGVLGLAGGIGGGLLGGAIMKGLESSPMFQAISKIMGTAFNLILRPIGDFFSAVFKPISIVLMKWGAVNLRNWAKSMQEGTNEAMNAASMIGKSIVAFFNDPLGLITAAIKSGLGLLDFNEYVTKAVQDIDASLTKQLGGIPGGMMAAGAGVISGIETKVKEASPDMKPVNDKLDILVDNTKPKTTPFGGYSSAEEQKAELDRLIEENKKLYPQWFKGTPEYEAKNAVKTEDDPQFQRASELAGVSAETWASLSDASKEVYERYLEYKEGVYDLTEANEAVLKVYEEHSKRNADSETTLAEIHAANMEIQRTSYSTMKDKIKGSEGDMKVIKDTTKEMMETIKDTYKLTLDTIISMRAMSAAASKKSKSGKAGGGLINERIFGVGERTGNEYLFGEAGREVVVPESKSGGLGNVTINVNVAKMSSDVDLQKLKPIIERAILETHARRGLI